MSSITLSLLFVLPFLLTKYANVSCSIYISYQEMVCMSFPFKLYKLLYIKRLCMSLSIYTHDRALL